MDLARARGEGISLFTHKSSEGNTYLDPHFAQAMSRAQQAKFPVLGAYHVLWPENPVSQADDWYSKVDANASFWRQHPCWIWQIDAELFQNFTPYRQPTVDEINACGDRIVARSGSKPSQVVVYAPEWLYGNSLARLKYRLLWASNYVPGSGGFKQLYPGDGSKRWHDYSGITPTILQYTSSATIAGQAPADANAVRVSTESELQQLFLQGDPVSATGPASWDAADWTAVRQNFDTAPYASSLNPDVARTLKDWVATNNYRITNDVLKAIADAKTAILATAADDATKAQLDAAVQQILAAVAAIPAGGSVSFDMTGTLTPKATP
jgi:Glycosyl hydrolases family 25